MQHFTLGRTNLEISRTGFGALPIQRVSFEEASALLNRALDGGITYIDTARAYSDSEEKIGKAISHRRDEFTLATKTGAQDAAGLERDLETSLRMLNTDHIDVYQFHNPSFVPRPGGAMRAGCNLAGHFMHGALSRRAAQIRADTPFRGVFGVPAA